MPGDSTLNRGYPRPNIDNDLSSDVVRLREALDQIDVDVQGLQGSVSTGDTGTVTSTMIADGTIVDADINANAAIVDTKLATIATAGKVSNSATTATSANTVSAIVARDASGNFSAGTITAALTGAASSNVLKAGDTMTGALLHPLGAAATPSITFTGNTNTGIFSPGADQVAVATNGAESLRITSAGNVGIGTTSPNELLEVAGNIHLSGADCSIFNRSNNALTFGTNNAERARIDSSGRLLVGTSSSRNVGGGPRGIQIESTSAGPQGLSITRNTNDDGGNTLAFGKSRGTANGSVDIVSSGDVLGTLAFAGADGTDLETFAGWIQCSVDGTPGTNDMPGRLVFSTTADGASSPTERMRITNSGSFRIGQTSTAAPGFGNTQVGVGFDNANKIIYASADSVAAIRVNRNSDGQIMGFRRSGSAGSVGGIEVTASSTSFVTSSDYRLKENVVDLDGAIDRLKQLPVYRFNFIADPDTVVDGFIAHEAAEVVPECVTGTKDEVDEDGNPVYQGIDQSKIVPLLTAALQEAVAKIEALEAEVQQLKA